MGKTDRDDHPVPLQLALVLAEGPCRPRGIVRLIIRSPDSAARRALLQLDETTRFDIEDRTCREREREVCVDDEPDTFALAGSFQKKILQCRIKRRLPIRVSAVSGAQQNQAQR